MLKDVRTNPPYRWLRHITTWKTNTTPHQAADGGKKLKNPYLCRLTFDLSCLMLQVKKEDQEEGSTVTTILKMPHKLETQIFISFLFFYSLTLLCVVQHMSSSATYLNTFYRKINTFTSIRFTGAVDFSLSN